MIYETSVPLRKPLRGISVVDRDSPWPEPKFLQREVPLSATSEPAAASSNREEIELLERLQTSLDDVTQELWGQQRQRLAEMQRVAVELAVAVASRLLHERIEGGDFAVENLVRQVAERLESQEALTVYLHPADLALLKQQAGAGRSRLTDERKLKLVADESLHRGDCRAETGDTSLLLKLDKQLEEVRKHLLDVLPEAEVEQRKAVPNDRQLRRFPERRHIA